MVINIKFKLLILFVSQNKTELPEKRIIKEHNSQVFSRYKIFEETHFEILHSNFFGNGYLVTTDKNGTYFLRS